MRKLWTMALCVWMLIALMGCGGDKMPATSSDSSTPATADYRLGLGLVNSTAMTDATHNRLKVTAAALLLDKDGRVVECELDEVDFTLVLAGGKASPADSLNTKGERGDSYIPTKEDTGEDDGLQTSWEDQAEAFCDYVEGKMVSEITALAATDGKSEKIDGCDLIITDFIRAVERAEDEAKPHDMSREDDLHLAVITAAADTATDQNPQYDIDLAVVALDEGDRITGCMTDTVQMKLTVEEGAFTTMSGEVKSKRQAGDSYGMKAASGIQREWYEQADAFDTFVRGKTAAELSKTSLDSEGKTDAISGCTMAVSGIMKAVAKAAAE